MAKLYFKVASDWQEVVRLRTEIERLKVELKNVDNTKAPVMFNTLTAELSASSQKMDDLVLSAAKAGSAIEGNFKQKIFEASKSVNTLSQSIISQRETVRNAEIDVKRYSAAYSNAIAKGYTNMESLKAALTKAKTTLLDEKDSLFSLTQQQANARLTVKKLRDEYALYKDEAKEVVEVNNGLGISWKQAIGVVGGVAALKALGSEIIKVRGEFKDMETSIKTLVGDDVANKLIPQIKELAKISPLTMTDMVGAEKMMLGFNVEADKTIGYLKAMSDISMGNSQKFNSLTLAFSQMSAAGKLMGQDLNQMINAGFNPLQVISEKTGKSISQLKDEMSKGALSAEMVQKAFIDATSAGGKFYNMSANASKEINGQISMMEDAMDEAFNKIGQKSEGLIMGGIKTTTALIENYEKVGKVLAGLIITYGAYRTAVILTTAAAGKHTIAEIALTNVRIAARKAQMLLNAAMLTNPYVALATVVAALGAAMWALNDSTTAAEKAEERYNKRKDELIKNEEEHRQKIDSLLKSCNDIALSDLQRVESLSALRREYPKIFEKYDIESIKLADILKLKQEIALEDERRALYNRNEERNKAFANVRNASNDITATQVLGGKATNEQLNKLKEAEAYLNNILKDDGKGIAEKFISSLKDLSPKQYDKYVAELEKRIKGKNGSVRIKLPIDIKGTLSDDAIYDVKDIKTLIDTVKAAKEVSENKNKDPKKKGADWKKEALAEWNKTKKDLSDLERSKTEYTKDEYEKEYKKRKDAEEAASKKFKELGGKEETKSGKSEYYDKSLELTKKYGEEKIKAEEDIATRIEQERLKTNSNAQKQKELENRIEIQTLERQKQAYINTMIKSEKDIFDAKEDLKSKKDKKYKKKLFDSSSVSVDTSSYDTLISATEQRQKAEKLRDEEKAWNEYLLKYGDFKQKKEAITKEYEEKISQVSTQGEKETLKRELESAIYSLNTEELKAKVDWVHVFGDLSRVSPDTLNRIKTTLQDYINNAASKINPDDLKELQNAITKIDIRSAENDPFKDLKTSLDEYKNSLKEIENAQADYEDVRKGAIIYIEKYDVASGKVVRTLLTEKEAEERVKKAQDKRYSSLSKLTTAINAVGAKGTEVTKIALGAIEVLENVGVGVSSEVKNAVDGLGKAFNAISEIDLTNPMSIIKGAVGVLGGLTQAVSGFFGKAHEVSAKTIKQYENLMDVLDKVISRQKEVLESLSGKEASDAYEKTKSYIEKQIQATKKLALEFLDSNAKNSHTYGYKLRKELESMKGDFDAIGISWKSIVGSGRMEGLFSLSPEQLLKIQKELPEAWIRLDDKTKEYLQTIIDCGDALDDLKDAIDESLGGVTFDAMYDNFKDKLMDMDSDNKTFTDNLTKYLQQAMLDPKIDSKYKKRVKEWYDAFIEANKDGSIDKTELPQLQDEWDKIVKDALAERDALKESLGWTSTTSQDSTKGTFQALSQDTGAELNGRFTAVQMAGEEIKVQNEEQTKQISLLNVSVSDIKVINTETMGIASGIRDCLERSYLELIEIRNNTGAIVKPIIAIQKDIEEVKRNTAKL